MTNDKYCKKPRIVEDDTDLSIVSDQGPDISVGHVRNDVKNVIETMGINIPKSIGSPRPETDNEESSYAAASCYSSIVQITEMARPADRRIFDSSIDNSAPSYIVSDEPTSCNSCAYSMECADSGTVSMPPVSRAVSIQYRYPPNGGHNMGGYYPNAGYSQQPNPGNMGGMPGQYSQNHLPTCQIPMQQQAIPQRASRLANWLGMKTNKRQPCNCNKHCDLYKINIEQPTADQSPPRRLVFDLMDELPKAPTKCKGTNTRQKKAVTKRSRGIHDHDVNTFDGGYPTEKVDIYYFDHGNSEFYRTTDISPAIMTEFLAERTERYTKKFWAQIFGTIHIGVAFVISFLLQLIRFLLQAIVRPLVVGVLQLLSDYFLKPCLAVTFNGILQPPMIFLYNWMTSLRDLMHPLAETIGYFVREIAVIFKAIRCFQFRSNNKTFGCKKRTKTKEEGCGLEDK